MVGNDVVDLNDLDADPASLHPRFDARVFCAEELEHLKASARPVQLRWRLWAAKEAAYKAVSKAHPGIVFSPSRFRVDLTTPVGAERVETGVVSCSAGPCQVTLAESDAAIHAVAHFDPAWDPAALTSLDGCGGTDTSSLSDVGSSDPDAAGFDVCEPRRPPRRDPAAVRAKLLRGQLRVDLDPAICEDPHAPSRAVRRFSCERLAAFLGVDVEELEIRRRGRIPELWLRGARTEADLSLSHHGAVVAFACELAPQAVTAANARDSR